MFRRTVQLHFGPAMGTETGLAGKIKYVLS
jgi:hypothetical protein